MKCTLYHKPLFSISPVYLLGEYLRNSKSVLAGALLLSWYQSYCPNCGGIMYWDDE